MAIAVSPEDKLKLLGLELPEPVADESNNRRAYRVGNLLFVSAHSPHVNGESVYEGVVGTDVDLKTAQEAATIMALCILATIKKYLGDLDNVKQIVRTYGIIQSAPDFKMQTAVLNVASDLFIEIFGRERAVGTRMPFGTVATAHNYSMLMDMIVEVKD